MPREPTKATEKGPDKSGPNEGDRKWQALLTWGEQGGPAYIQALCYAIANEEAIPTFALRPLLRGLELLTEKRSSTEQLRRFAAALGLQPKRGRPDVDDLKFSRAINYWMLRIGDSKWPPMTDKEAIEHIRERGVVEEDGSIDLKEDSAVRRAVREHPEAEQIARAILAPSKLK